MSLNNSMAAHSLLALRLSPSEQDIYATAHLGRAISYSAGHHARQMLPGLLTGNSPQEQADLSQQMFLGMRTST